MKTELKAKFLQHMTSKKKGNEGFTLIELLVVVIIIGILAAIALPSMLNQASRARLAGAQNSAGAVNRAQQAYRLEKPVFAPDFANLGIGEPKSEGYTYVLIPGTAVLGQVNATPADPATDKGVSGCATANAAGLTTISVNVPLAAGPAPGC